MDHLPEWNYPPIEASSQLCLIDDVIALVEVYYALPTEALRIVLRKRGLNAILDLDRLDSHHLAALAVHTHTPGWDEVRRLQRRLRPQKIDTGPVMCDAGL